MFALTRCGGGYTSPPPPPGNGVVITQIGDAPLCDVLSFRILVSSLTVFHPNSTFPHQVFPGAVPSAVNIKVNLGSMRDFQTILNISSVEAGEYDRARIAFLFPQAVVYDPTQSPPTSNPTLTLVNGSVPITFNPPMVVTKNQLTTLLMDFDMRRSFQLDAQGQLTGKLTPVVSLLPVAASPTQGFGEMDDMVGFVRSVTPTSTPPSPFTGSIGLQLLSGTGPLINANLNSSTLLYGVPALNQLPTDSFVEMDAFVDTKGNLIANTVEVENREDPLRNILAFLGIVTTVTKDSSGNVTQFTLLNREEEPDNSLFLALDRNLVVSVTPSTIYQYSSRATNFAGVPFGPTSLAVGQEVIVHGAYTLGSGTNPTTVAATKVYLKLQSHEGNFSSLISVGSDDRTGAFWLAPCASIFQRSPILVLTSPQTNFLNVTGLNGLTSIPSLLVKGLLFFELEGSVINGVSVPPGSLVLLAKQVHQLS